MYNAYQSIKGAPHIYKQLVYDELLFAEYKCPILEKKKAMWSENNIIIFVARGHKTWQTPYGTWDLHAGDCILIKKGAFIIEQFFDEEFCLMAFFFPDQFVRKAVKDVPYALPLAYPSDPKPIITISITNNLMGFFQSMQTYFDNSGSTDKNLIMLKFSELMLNLYTAKENPDVASYFQHLKRNPQTIINEIMENNFSYNLALGEYAELCNMSLSTFKRKFFEVYRTSPHRWLVSRRLNYAKLLLETTDKSITEIVFESGFENLSHFSKIFKDRFNASPQSYREKLMPGTIKVLVL